MNDLDLFEEPAWSDQRDRRRGRRAQAAVRKRQRRRKLNSRAAVLFSLAFLVAVFGGGGLIGLAVLDRKLSVPDYSGQGAGSVIVQIKDGDTGWTIGERLEKAGVVKSAKAYVKAAEKEPRSAGIQPGFYTMRKKMSAAAALALLLDPKSRAGNQITIPEGLRAVQVVDQLSKRTGIPRREFHKVLKNPEALELPPYAKGKVEGYLWPGRYDLDPNGTAESVLKAMVDRYKKEVADLDLEAKARAAGLEPHEVMTMASIVQAESGKPSDMPKIAEVIHNRLEKSMLLQMDSTTKYANGTYGIEATAQERASTSPYNTYRVKGLPPGPIANPGADAIRAVLEPTDDGWLFFVTTDPEKGVTKFARTLAEHNRLVAEYNRNKRNGGG
ncbi:endolytic transglycosylase MltG [Thermomonospora catenispora]|uniref:endolytic transglycosylase MltG n=1 Tax=Thermomonospora catenispora TaxID=2493090 RepID=UPI0011212FAA|nr:endolytic transglycosylase MltG [Thermomonospora catenispora]TNY35339.1 endolytic transglycosylase MltG [Thermomonospora catenispora]